jgi:hypothetical protein
MTQTDDTDLFDRPSGSVYPTIDELEGREKGIDTPEALKKTLEEWARKGGKGDKPQFAWIFGEYTDADAVAARQYLATMDAFTS